MNMRARDIVRGERKLVQELEKLLAHIGATQALCDALVENCIYFRQYEDVSSSAKLDSRVRSLERLALAIRVEAVGLEIDVACDVDGNAAVRHVNAQSKRRKAKRS